MPDRIRMSTFLALLAAIATGGCASSPSGPATPEPPWPGLVVVVVRHAEKDTATDSDDPPLTRAGQARAERLARSLAGAPVVATYATAYRRTRATAEPTATASGLPVTTYDARRPAGELAGQLRGKHAGGTVLVVGHSNTVPALAAALCGCDVSPMDESEYGRRMTIAFDADGTARFSQSTDP